MNKGCKAFTLLAPDIVLNPARSTYCRRLGSCSPQESLREQFAL
jgi:hypothetical protein